MLAGSLKRLIFIAKSLHVGACQHIQSAYETLQRISPVVVQHLKTAFCAQHHSLFSANYKDKDNFQYYQYFFFKRVVKKTTRILIFPLKENFKIAVKPADSSLEVRYSQFKTKYLHLSSAPPRQLKFYLKLQTAARASVLSKDKHP